MGVKGDVMAGGLSFYSVSQGCDELRTQTSTDYAVLVGANSFAHCLLFVRMNKQGNPPALPESLNFRAYKISTAFFGFIRHRRGYHRARSARYAGDNWRCRVIQLQLP